MLRVMIEGPKFSGKSTLADILRQRVSTSSVIEFRAYFRKGFSSYTISNKIEERLKNLSIFINNIFDDDLILLRGHLSPFALSKATNQKIYVDFFDIDKEFTKSNILLILLTLNEKCYYQRLEHRELLSHHVKEWDRNWSNISTLQEAYIDYFNKSKLQKYLFCTSEHSPEYIANEILGVKR